MFKFFFSQAQRVLSNTGITGKPSKPVQLQQLESSSDALFNLIFDDGRQNFTRLLGMLYDRQLASTRIKLMILFHSLILEGRGYAELFLAHPKLNLKDSSSPGSNLSLTRPTSTQRQRGTPLSEAPRHQFPSAAAVQRAGISAMMWTMRRQR